MTSISVGLNRRIGGVAAIRYDDFDVHLADLAADGWKHA
jgi:hypothetical protein